MRIAVSGANGFVGEALCGHLRTQNIETTPLVRRNNKAKFVDYNSKQSMCHALKGCDVLIHLIARTHHRGESLNTLEAYRNTNVKLSIKLAAAAASAGVKRIVFLSSIKANGEKTDTSPFTDLSPPCPSSAYGISKLEAEHALSQQCKADGLELVIVRIPLVYAPHAKGNIALISKAIRWRIPLPFANVNNKRSLIDLPQLCSTLEKCATQAAAAGKTYLIANQESPSTPALIRRIARDHKKPALLFPAPRWLLLTAGKLLGKTEEVERLVGNLEIVATQPFLDTRAPISTNPLSEH